MIKIVTSPIYKGSKIEYWRQNSPVGQLILARSSKGICYLGFGECFDNLDRRFDDCMLVEIDHSEQIDQIETLHLVGTEFQIEVWEALLQIPKGSTVSYAYIAQSIGRPLAVRAVGSAVGANPVSLIVPCHRVLRADGSLGGYFWGLELKAMLLNYENATFLAPTAKGGR